MKNWKMVLSSLLALLIMIVTPLSVTAASNNETLDAAAVPVLKGALEIVAPRIAHPGSEVFLTVFLRKDQSVVEDVEIWAASKNSVMTLKNVANALRKKRIGDLTGDNFQSLLEANAEKIGVTDEDGKLTFTLNEAGKYILLAVKSGYRPDFSILTVRNILVIDGPEKALSGDNVTFSVSEKETEAAAAEAEVWSVTKKDMPALKAALKKERLDHKNDPGNADWTGVLKAQAESLGTTGENGQLTCTFSQEGKYGLIAFLDGDLSGFFRIIIESP
jgi:hypothetical protein